jgi:hypothetical protein
MIKTKETELDGLLYCMQVRRDIYETVVIYSEGMRPFVTIMYRREDYSVVTNVKETEIKRCDWIYLACGTNNRPPLLNKILSSRVLSRTFMDLNDLLPAKEGRCLTTSLFRDIPRTNAGQKVGVFVFSTFNRATE